MIAPSDASSLSIPDRVGKHVIVGKLASGGMATTFLARLVGPAGFENVVVLKRMLPHLAEDPRFRVMFEDEARTVARIRHPNVVRIFELVSEVGELYLVMEYLEGDTLRQLLTRLAQRRERLPWPIACHIVSEAALGLHAAHELTDDDGRVVGLVHRDVSPHNLFVTSDGSVKVIDFGIAKSADHVSHTSTGELKGKFAYMSPEQVEQRPIDRRTDVFALGVVLWELVAQRRLFARDTQMATMRAVADHPVPRLSSLVAQVPASLDALVARALERDPDARVKDMLELRRGLLDVIRDAGLVDPKVELATLARTLLATEMKERAALIRRSRGASSAIVGPSAPDAEGTPSSVRAATAATVGASAASPDVEIDLAPARSENRSRVLLAGVLAVAFVGVAAAGGWALAAGGEPAPSTTAVPSPAPAPPPTVARPTTPVIASPPSPAETAPARAAVTFETVPPGALVTLDGIARGTTPLSLDLPRGDGAMQVELALAGHRAVTLSFVPDRDQTLRAPLTRTARSTTTTTMESATSMERGEGFYAFE